MNYFDFIPFNGPEEALLSDSRCDYVDLPSTTTAPTIADVLFEQLEYLIQFADQEQDRLDRVKAILLETFN